MIELAAAEELEAAEGEVLAVPVLTDRVWGPGGEWVAERLGGRLTEVLDEADFDGKPGQVASMPTPDGFPFGRVLLIGLGDEVELEGIRQAAGWVGRRTARNRDVATTLHQVDVEGASRAVAEGFLLAQYRFDRYRSEARPPLSSRLRLIGANAAQLEEAERGRIVANAVVLARDLINEPAGGKAPAAVAELAAAMAEPRQIDLEILDEAAISDLGLGGLLGVAAGSERPPRLLRLRYRPEGAKVRLALVGKGITFDSGGLTLKPGAAMETMKTDVSGAAAVLGALQAISDLGLEVEVVAITPLADNMPGGGATKPGDVLRARNGTTIEVLNTDAEGRLVLADGLVLAGEVEPDLIVDLATLTGACHVALGDKIAGVWSNDDGAAQSVMAAARRAGERVWAMPLPDDYRKNLESDVADLKNVGASRYGGAINAALFLREFVGEVPWVHVDIAGPARWPEEEHYQSKGGSGFGVRTMVTLAEDLADRLAHDGDPLG